MSNDNILTEFTSFIAKSAAAMQGDSQAPSIDASMSARAPALVSPAVTTQGTPRMAAMPTHTTALTDSNPRPGTNTGKPIKPTNFNSSAAQ